MNNSEIISSDIAFLGHGSKMASIKHRFNHDLLICRESQCYLLPPTLLSLYFGLFIPLAIYYSLIDLSKTPLFASILLFIAFIGSWILFIAMLLYQKRITFDFSSNSLIFFKKVLKKKQYHIDLSLLSRIVSGRITRVKSDSSGSVVICYFFSVILSDNTQIRICETTSKKELEIIINTIVKQCRQKPQWLRDNVEIFDNFHKLHRGRP